MGPESMRRPSPAKKPPPLPASAPAAPRWDDLRVALPRSARSLDLDEIELPARMRTYAEREGLRTLGDLADRSAAQLCSAQNLNRKSVAHVAQVVRERLPRLQAIRKRAATGLLPSWRAFLAEQDPVPRLVLALRAGLDGPAETLRAIGKRLGVTGERARQIEAGALDDLGRRKTWLGEVRARVDAAIGRGSITLEALAADPWWAAIVALPDALDYFCERVLAGEVRVVALDDRAYLARCSQTALDDAWSHLHQAAGDVSLPAPIEAFEALTAPAREALGDMIADALAERLRALLHLDAASAPEARVTAFGTTHAASLLAILRASPTPVRLDEIWARLGRGDVPDEVLLFGSHQIGLERHFPDFASWMERLVPAAIQVMEREGPERQWLAGELLDELREPHDVPEWLTEWHLGGLLRKSGQVRYLGRLRVALLDAADDRGRLQFHDELLRILREHGEPMAREDLIAELRKRTSIRELTVRQCLTRHRFLRCGGDRIGLIERDLPGGADALAAAASHAAALLEQRGRGVGAAELQAEVVRLSPDHARWTTDMCLSVLRSDARFRLSNAGAVGLASWESVRVPTRMELVRQCIEEAGGRVRVEVVRRRIRAFYGEAPDRMRIGMMANRFGAGLRGDWIERGAAGG
jgi:hypothetical protein